MQKVTMISECIEEINGFNPSGAKTLRELNVVRCNRFYATLMAEMKEHTIENNIFYSLNANACFINMGFNAD